MIMLSATLALAAPPQEAVVQGLYEGVWKDAGGSLPAEVRVVALGDKKFALMARRKLADGMIDRAEQYILDHTPMRRMGTGQDLKGVTVLLASEASAFMTGVTIPVDGGFSAL